MQFVIKRDSKKHFHFAALESEAGKQLLNEPSLPVTQSGTFILVEDGKIYTQSTAALRVAKKLNGLWPLLYLFIIVPAFIRNAVYNYVAKNRYRWFGKKDSCWIPTQELKDRFLE